ncbi:homoserine dehydrogenase [Marilutibacter alkalisoli]|uniref:Homoserine dehydrogenase n=1 Tax=Marilutibacter alkalisoli TaxID=2591633 RepID=A0A514BPJ7_9GAMM|nr:homoserine dehydrogenase [Lysobacter alkalisoli]QDH69303.1 homoserine dehydrogenase [Lysobacter alkalisoli]
MSALAEDVRRSLSVATAQAPRTAARARLALLGTGNVGGAVLERLAGWVGTPFGEKLELAYVANTRQSLHPHTLTPTPLPQTGEGLSRVAPALGEDGTRIVIDATASAEVAARHAGWLAQGIHVVTACKLARGTSLAAWQVIEAACVAGDSHYGDAATVGAGLPLLRSIRELRAGGDRVTAIAGVLSGSLAWLFNHYDGLRPFSGFVREARDAGYTEPDPREDLSGEDVRRKLLILARAAGVQLEQDEVEVASLVPDEIAALPKEEVDASLPRLDPLLRERYAKAYKNGEKLRFIARLERNADGGWSARVGLDALSVDHPLAGGAGTDNKVAIWSDRYDDQPLVIQGPGAGAGVTAAGLLDDALRIARGWKK